MAEGWFDARSDWVVFSGTITERRHKSAAADPDAGILLGGISLPGVSSPETDGRRAVVVVACPLTFMGGFGSERPVYNGRVRVALFGRRRRSRRRSHGPPGCPLRLPTGGDAVF